MCHCCGFLLLKKIKVPNFVITDLLIHKLLKHVFGSFELKRDILLATYIWRFDDVFFIALYKYKDVLEIKDNDKVSSTFRAQIREQMSGPEIS